MLLPRTAGWFAECCNLPHLTEAGPPTFRSSRFVHSVSRSRSSPKPPLWPHANVNISGPSRGAIGGLHVQRWGANTTYAHALLPEVFRGAPVWPWIDPLSITTGIIAVAGLATKTCSAIADLRSTCKGLPGRLHAVSNEVADLEMVLTNVAALLKSRPAVLGSQSLGTVSHLLVQARNKLNEIRGIVDKLTAASERSKIPLVEVSIWRNVQGRLQTLQDDLRTFKSSLNILLGASNS